MLANLQRLVKRCDVRLPARFPSSGRRRVGETCDLAGDGSRLLCNALAGPCALHPPDSTRMAHVFVGELDAQLKEVLFGIESASAASADGTAALSTAVTLEGLALALRMDDGGVHVLSQDGQPVRSYDSVNSLLLNESAGFVAKFNASLSAALAAAVNEQGDESGQRRWADLDEEDDNASYKSYDSAQDDRPWH